MLLIAAVTFLVMLTVVAAYWFVSRTFQGRLFLYKLYKVGSLAKTKIVDTDGKFSQWTKSEQHLDEMDTYLKKSAQSDRRPMPLAIVFALFILVAAEAMGFSFLLSQYMAMEGSQNILLLLTAAIVIVICLLMVAITHSAGHQLYVANLCSKFRKQWEEDPSPSKGAYEVGGRISPNDDQKQDDNRPRYNQFSSRAEHKDSYFMVWVAGVAIVLIFGLSTYMRWEHLKEIDTQEAMGSNGAAVTQQGGNPYGTNASQNGLPSQIVDDNKAVEAKGKGDEQAAKEQGGLAAFVFLGVIFVFTQIVGIFAGHKWGFINEQAASAYRATKGFASYNEVKLFQDQFIVPVEELMAKLQSKMGSSNVIGKSHTFKQFLTISDAPEVEQPITPVSRPKDDGATISAVEPRKSVAEVVAFVGTISDKGEKNDYLKKYIASLPEADRAGARAEIVSQIELAAKKKDEENEQPFF